MRLEELFFLALILGTLLPFVTIAVALGYGWFSHRGSSLGKKWVLRFRQWQSTKAREQLESRL